MLRLGTTWRLDPHDRRYGCYAYDARYVNALRSQARDRGLELTVLTNQPDVRGGVPLMDQRLFGWWSKMEWFAPWNAHLRPALVVDLDTFLMGDITPLLELDPTHLWMIRQFYKTSAQLGESGIFVAPLDCMDIWARLMSLRRLERGDGDFLRQSPHKFIPDVVDGIHSYKVHDLRNYLLPETRVVCFHGDPKPPDAGGWASEYFALHASAP